MFQFGGFNMMFPDSGRNFKSSYRCFSVSMLPGNEREDVENGGKIIMPPSALDSLTRLNVEYPMLFKLSNNKKARYSHAGVLEFVADEGKCYLPFWMMDNLFLEEGELLTIESVSLPVAKFSKFQPHSIDFLDITNPKAVLENALRSFACLTAGDVIAIKYNKRVYELCVLETKPGGAVSIIECDMNVEFEAPVGYKDTNEERKPEDTVTIPTKLIEEIVEPFAGSGVRLDGKRKKDTIPGAPVMKKVLSRGVPEYNYKIGHLSFDRSIIPITDRDSTITAPPKAIDKILDKFEGYGYSMRKTRK